MALGSNSLVQVSCQKRTRVMYVPPVRLRKSGHQPVDINGKRFALAIRRIRGIEKALVIDEKGEFAFLHHDEPVYFRREGVTYSFLLAEDFANPDSSPFANRVVAGILFHCILVATLGLLPLGTPNETSRPSGRIDVARVKQVLDRVAERQREKTRLIENKTSASIPAPPVPALPPVKSGAPKSPVEDNSFLPQGFEGIRRRALPQRAPITPGAAPLRNQSSTTLRTETNPTASGLGKRGEGAGGGGGGGKSGWGPAISGNGSISLALVEKALAENRMRLLSCYDTLLLNRDTVEGRLLFSWEISPQGKASQIKLLRSNVKGRQFHLCLADVLQSTRFPKPEGGAVTIRYPFEFTQAPDER